MSLFRDKEQLKIQIIETEHMLDLVSDHPLMSESLRERLSNLRQKIESLPDEIIEAKIQMLFSGNAVSGSIGIKSEFLSKALKPFQEMIKTQAAIVRYGRVGARGKAKKGPNTDLFLTALPVGSFGVELSQLEGDEELFETEEVSEALKGIVKLIQHSSIDDQTFETAIDDAPERIFTNLKKFLKEVAEENSILKMVCGELGVEITSENILNAYNRVNDTSKEDSDLVVKGVFRGILLDSGRFEVQDEEGQKLSGFISKELQEDVLVNYDQEFLNSSCEIHLKVHTTTFKSGKQKIEYELLEISAVA